MDNQFQGGDVNLYEGLRCHGVPLVTISRGRLVYENGMFTCAEGSGKFCPLRTFPDYLYKKMVQREKVSVSCFLVYLFVYLFISFAVLFPCFVSFCCFVSLFLFCLFYYLSFLTFPSPSHYSFVVSFLFHFILYNLPLNFAFPLVS